MDSYKENEGSFTANIPKVWSKKYNQTLLTDYCAAVFDGMR